MSVLPNHPPLWVLRQTILPYGARLPKMPPLWEEPKSPVVITDKRRFFQQFDWDRGRGPNNAKVFSHGNLDNNDYRYWIGLKNSLPGDGVAICRCCHAVFPVKLIKNHKQGCPKKLEAAYALLQKDKRCVICNEETSRQVWGVPLCSMQHIDEWRFAAARPHWLIEALRLVGHIEKKAETES
jgi:hypothetical protein